MKEIINVGFTGTRKGMSWNQEVRLVELFSSLKAQGYDIEFHHGCCIGADCQADRIARNFGAKMHLHPSNDPKTRVNCFEPGDTICPERPPLVRDQDIVYSVNILYAAPLTDKEVVRSGTWTTVRMARKRKIKIEVMKR